MIHIKTKKGKGYSYAEEATDNYHGVSKFNVETGEQVKSGSNLPSYTKVFASTLVKHAQKDSKIVGITAAMPGGTGMDIFAREFPTEFTSASVVFASGSNKFGDDSGDTHRVTGSLLVSGFSLVVHCCSLLFSCCSLVASHW